MMNKATIAICALALALCAIATAQNKSSQVTVPFFGNKTCPVSSKPADRSIGVKHNGEKIFVCCKKCVKEVKGKPATYYTKAYPRTKVVDVKNVKCPVMGGKTKGKEAGTEFQGHRVHYCCPMCDKKFREEPNKNLAKLTRKGLKDLGNKKCPVSNDENVSPDSFLIYKDQIVNLCCNSCVDDFKKSPEKYLKVTKSNKKGKKGHDHGGHDHKRS